MNQARQASFYRKYFFGGFLISFNRGFKLLFHGSAYKRTIILLELIKFWKGMSWNQAFRITGINTQNKRIYRIIQKGLPHSSFYKFGQCLIRVFPGLSERFTQKPKLIFPGEQGCFNSIPKSRRKRFPFSLMKNITFFNSFAGYIRLTQTGQLLKHFRYFRVFYDACVRTVFKNKPILLPGTNYSAGFLIFFNNRYIISFFPKIIGCR